MAGTSFSVETKGFEKVREVFQQLGNPDLRPLLDALGAEGESQTRRRISEEKTAPDGTPWDPLAEDYAKRKTKGIVVGGVRVASSGGILEFEGEMLDSINYQVTGDDTVEWGSNKIYAAIHQFGGAEAGMNVPSRPFLGISDDNALDMDVIITDWAQDMLQ